MPSRKLKGCNDAEACPSRVTARHLPRAGVRVSGKILAAFECHPTPVTSAPNGCKAARPYFNRYTDDTIDLCDVLSSFSSPSKDALCMNFVAQMLGVKTSDGVGS